MEKKLQDSFDLLNPTKEQSEKMWNDLKKAQVSKQKKKRRADFGYYRYALTAAMITVIVLCSGITINAASGGKLVTAIQEIFGVKQGKQDVAGQAQEIKERGIEVWAPEIYGIDDKYLVFGTQRGLVVYDVTKNGICATIDVQKIGCIYFNSDPKQTHVLVKEDRVILFNSDNGVPFGSSYEFSLEGAEGEITEVNESDNKEQLNNYYNLWEAGQKVYTDTFDKFNEHGTYKELLEKEAMYSERAVSWTTEDGESLISFLVVEAEGYCLYNYHVTNDSFETTSLTMENLYETKDSLEGSEDAELPLFTYCGDNMALKAVCEYFEQDALSYAEAGEVFVPGFVIYEEVQKGEEYLVFGNFWTYSYRRNGNMMESASGGEMPACFHLKENADGYEVISVDVAGDGEEYVKGIKEFTKDYPGLYEKFMNGGEERSEAMKEYMAMYVTANNLDIQYIKEYGWDPVAIFE